jgi:hypothetical protein
VSATHRHYLKREKRQRIEIVRKSIVDDVDVFRASRQNPSDGCLIEKRHRQPQEIDEEGEVELLGGFDEAVSRHELA